ncbi:hypothetical protein BD289DRAFT_226775 [Coniella lustricola]|uniref:Uncharacterized protein n=1 Tax=Coniella lustricola TaxID=2025994 RepID=A0A2T3AAL4_9PEZI|nr:hypothetical protein BD289DRAFT_226775 [Coniella lustricola]
MLHPPALVSRSLTTATLICAAILLVSLGESLKVVASAPHNVNVRVTDMVQRSWKAELGPFVFGPPQDSDKDRDDVEAHSSLDASSLSENQAQVAASKPGEDVGFPLPAPPPTAFSIVTSFLGAGIGGVPSFLSPIIPLPLVIPTSTSDSGGGLLGSVISILAGTPNPTPLPSSPSGANGPLGGLLSALSAVASSPDLPEPMITTPPSAAPAGAGGLLPGLGIINGVASALTAVLGSPNDNDNDGSGLLGQLSANVLNPITAIAANPAAVLADPLAAVSNLQSQISAALDSMPSAVAAGVQFAGQVGSDLADALDSTSDLLSAAPDVAGGVADQVGSLLQAGPNLATGIPAAALSAVNQIESILSTVPDTGSDVSDILNGLKDDLSSALTNVAPGISSLAAAIGSQVVGVLPTGLQPLVSAVITSIQNNEGALTCYVSDVVSGTTLVFGVPCSASSSGTGSPLTATVAMPPATSPSSTIQQTQPESSSPQLVSLLSSLSSSVVNAASTAPLTTTPATASYAISVLSGLASLISQVSQLSLTATTLALLPSAPASTSTPPSAMSTITVAQTTIYYIRTITELMTSTEIRTDVMAMCPSAFSSYSFASSPSTLPGSLVSSAMPSSTDGSAAGSCPGQGYTCDDCVNGWFCPPLQTPALPAPCGYGWPCYHCRGGWFCAPMLSTAGATTRLYSL